MFVTGHNMDIQSPSMLLCVNAMGTQKRECVFVPRGSVN